MAKKTANMVMMILLLMATGGIPITRHYCGATAISFSVYSTPKQCCKGPCNKCHNVFKFTKVNDDFDKGTTIVLQSLADYLTLYHSLFVELLNNLVNAPHPLTIHFPAGFIALAGLSPASLGNFRC